jgi:hypothetical protein
VQSIEGSTLTVTGDDGKPVTVDTSKLKPEAVRALRWSQPVEATGLFDAKRTRFTATDLEPATGPARPPPHPLYGWGEAAGSRSGSPRDLNPTVAPSP